VIRRVLLIAAINGAIASKAMAAIAHVQDIGTGSVTAATTITLNVGSPVAVNDTVVMAISTDTNLVVPTVNDSRGNSYLQGLLNTTSAGFSTVGFSGLLTNALLPGDTITVTFPVAVNGLVTASEFSGVAFLSGVAADHNSGSASFAPALLPGVSGGELLFAWVALSGTSSSVSQDVTFTPMPAITANGLTLFPAYKLAPSAGSYIFSGTLGASEQWIAQIESGRVAAPMPTPTPIPPQTAAVPTLSMPIQALLVLALALIAFTVLRRPG